MNFPAAGSFPSAPDGDPLSSSPSNTRLVLLLAVLLAVGTVALYAPALKNGFVNFDDPDYVTRNSHVVQGLSWPNIVWAFGTDNPAANWHPLTWISHMLDVQWYGLRPMGHHFTNVLLQTLDVVLLFLLLESATRLALPSAAVAALFAAHPLNVESVAWIAERKAVLCMFFFLLALGAYGWYARKPSPARYLCVMLFFALGLMSKIMVIALPFGLLLLDYWPLRRLPDIKASDGFRPILRGFFVIAIEKIPLLLLAAAAGWMTLYMHKKEGALTAAMPLAWRLKNVTHSYLAYLGKTFWPTRLAVFYPHPENSLPWWKVIGAALILAAICAVVWYFRSRKYLLVGWLWFLGTIVPMIGFIQSGRQGMADRYIYIPILGLFVAVVWLLADLAARLRWSRAQLTALFAVLILPCIYLTHKQIGFWHGSYTLFSHALEVTENNGIAENNLGSALVEMGQPQLAEPHFEAAIRLIPTLASAHYNFAVLLQRQNRLEDAAKQYGLAIANSSDPLEAAQAHNNLGILYLGTKNLPAALAELNSAIALNPNEQNSYIGRGTIELQSWNYDAAIADFARAAQIAPSPIACYWLGRALESKGDYPHAANAYVAALRLAPGMADARTRLEVVQTKSGESR